MTENKYYVKIRLYDNLPDMPRHGEYVGLIIKADSEEEVRMVISDHHKITVLTMMD